MGEVFQVVKDAMVNGLAPDDRIGRDEPFCEYMQNLKPFKYGAVSPETVTFPWESAPVVTAWPYPQLLQGEQSLLLADRNAIYSMGTSSPWASSAITVYDPQDHDDVSALEVGGTGWHMASFTDAWLMTNGLCLAFCVPGYSPKAFVADSPTIQSLVGHDTRLFVGGPFVTSPHPAGTDVLGALLEHWTKVAFDKTITHATLLDNLGPTQNRRWLMWGPPGGGSRDYPFVSMLAAMGMMGASVFTKLEPLFLQQIDDGEMGFLLLTCGDIQAMKVFGDDILVYGDKGINKVYDNGGRYWKVSLMDVGIAGRGAVDGDAREHVFVSKDGQIWRLRQGEAPANLDYSWLIGDLALPQTQVVFDGVFGDYWISDGTTCYVLTPFGLGGPVDVKPTSLVRMGGLMGAAVGLDPEEDPVAILRTCEFDLGNRGSKAMSAVPLSVNGFSSLSVKTYHRANIFDPTFAQSESFPVNANGVAMVRSAFVDAKLEIRGVVPNNDARIHSAEIRYEPVDRRFVRGISPGAKQR